MSSTLAMLEMVKNGTTSFLEAGGIIDTDTVAEVAMDIGMRAFLGDPFIKDINPGGATTVDHDKDRAYKLLGNELIRNKNKNELVQGVVTLSGMGTASDNLLKFAKDLADKNNVILNMHQSYQDTDYMDDNNRLGLSPMVHFENIGLLDKNCTFSHVNRIDEKEIGPILDSNLSIVWCPMASMLYGVGGTINGKHLELFKNGLNISFGCDSANWTSAFDIGEQAFIALLTAREKTGDPSALTAEEILRISTINGSKALCKENEFGSLEVGKRADLIVRKTLLPESLPGFDPVREVMISSRSKSIDMVIINGDIVVEKGNSTKIDEDEFASKFKVFHEKLVERLENA
jgi:cytosine/adenosine deaminase-related metal-dependent hydrolase